MIGPGIDDICIRPAERPLWVEPGHTGPGASGGQDVKLFPLVICAQEEKSQAESGQERTFAVSSCPEGKTGKADTQAVGGTGPNPDIRLHRLTRPSFVSRYLGQGLDSGKTEYVNAPRSQIEMRSSKVPLLPFGLR